MANDTARHAPSPAKLKRARERGDSPRSGQLIAAMQCLVIVGTMAWLVPAIGSTIVDLTIQWWSNAAATRGNLDAASEQLVVSIPSTLLPVTLLSIAASVPLVVVTLWATWGQTGLRMIRRSWGEAPVFSPARNLANWFSLQRIVTVAGQFLTLLLVAIWILAGSGSQMEKLLQIDLRDPQSIVGGMLRIACLTGGGIAGIMAAAGLCDLWIQRRVWYRRQMMTDQEVREEARQDSSPRQRFSRSIAGSASVEGIESTHTG